MQHIDELGYGCPTVVYPMQKHWIVRLSSECLIQKFEYRYIIWVMNVQICLPNEEMLIMWLVVNTQCNKLDKLFG